MKSFVRSDPYQVYVYTCFLSQLFFTLVFTVNLLYHVEMVKLDALQLVFVGTVLELSVFLFEIPTGIVADLKSRKLSVMLGFLLIGMGFILEGLFPYFSAVIIAQILWGIGYTFTSGAHQAWISDEIGEERASSAFIDGSKAGNLGRMIAIPLSISIGYYQLNLPIIIGGICMLGLSILIFFFMKEENFTAVKRKKKQSAWSSIKANMSQVVYYFRMNQLMRMLLLIALFFGFYSEGLDRLWLPHFLQEANLSELSERHLVLVTGGIQLVIVFTSWIVLDFMSKSTIHLQLKSIYAALFIGSLIIISSLVGFASSTSVIGLLGFYMLIQLSRTMMNPLESIWLNKIIPDASTRATFFSLKGQVDAIGQMGGGPIIGYAALNFTIKVAFIVSAILLMPVLILFGKVMKKAK
jgi:MFS transporter, DHA3 family, tetracycline resistance protein